MDFREIHLTFRPVGLPSAEDFQIATVSRPAPAEGEVQVRNLWLTVDPYMLPRMQGIKGYLPPYELEAPLEGEAVGEVIASGCAEFRPGDLVLSTYGWREGFNAPKAHLRRLPAIGLPPETFLGAAGLTGLTAYVGLMEIGRLQAGETVFISGAAGSVGLAACQIAKLKGARVIASAGGAQKTRFLSEQVGVDAVIDYKSTPDLAQALRGAAPKGIDVYFDNVGGAHLEAALECARRSARIVLCGMISGYGSVAVPTPPKNFYLAITKSLRMEGFVTFNHMGKQEQFLKELLNWHRAGDFEFFQTVRNGLEQAPDAFLGLFAGENTGKMLVKLA
ncbi:MAG: NADP-dependent oxidoreductase [Pseudodonghicola sp.]